MPPRHHRPPTATARRCWKKSPRWSSASPTWNRTRSCPSLRRASGASRSSWTRPAASTTSRCPARRRPSRIGASASTAGKPSVRKSRKRWKTPRVAASRWALTPRWAHSWRAGHEGLWTRITARTRWPRRICSSRQAWRRTPSSLPTSSASAVHRPMPKFRR